MNRIVYLVFGPIAPTGGVKVTFRHVEALNARGFDAVVRIVGGGHAPTWFAHDARVEGEAQPLREDDILVLPEDAAGGLRRFAGHPHRKVLFCQNPYWASGGLGQLAPEEMRSYRTFMACSVGVAGWIARFMDYDRIVVAPGFADERLFAPAAKHAVIAAIPRKRPMEAQAILQMFRRLYTGAVDWRWEMLDKATEAEVASVMGRAAVFLSLNRFEGMGMTTLEAMASECLVAGFTGLGSRDYTTPLNGLWVEEDDCEAAARALLRAVALAEDNTGAATLMRLAGRATAQAWSYANFVRMLEDFWSEPAWGARP